MLLEGFDSCSRCLCWQTKREEGAELSRGYGCSFTPNANQRPCEGLGRGLGPSPAFLMGFASLAPLPGALSPTCTVPCRQPCSAPTCLALQVPTAPYVHLLPAGGMGGQHRTSLPCTHKQCPQFRPKNAAGLGHARQGDRGCQETEGHLQPEGLRLSPAPRPHPSPGAVAPGCTQARGSEKP